jgi:membrane protease YdiL (CAAX protease family)
VTVDAAAGRRRDLLLFCVLACAFSWTDWGLVIASARGWLPVRVGPNPWGSFGPAVAAVAMCALRGRAPGVRGLLRGLLAWRFPGRIWAWSLLLPAGLVLGAAAVLFASGAAPQAAGPLRPGELALLAILILVLGGPLGEEIGWRGYLLPRLLPRMSPVAASLVVAGAWLVWHLPLFWMPDATQQGSSILLFAAFVAAFSILATWVYRASGDSLLAAVAFHFAVNYATYVGPVLQPALGGSVFDRILLAATWIAALIAARALSRPAGPIAALAGH